MRWWFKNSVHTYNMQNWRPASHHQRSVCYWRVCMCVDSPSPLTIMMNTDHWIVLKHAFCAQISLSPLTVTLQIWRNHPAFNTLSINDGSWGQIVGVSVISVLSYKHDCINIIFTFSCHKSNTNSRCLTHTHTHTHTQYMAAIQSMMECSYDPCLGGATAWPVGAKTEDQKEDE